MAGNYHERVNRCKEILFLEILSASIELFATSGEKKGRLPVLQQSCHLLFIKIEKNEEYQIS